MNGTCPLCGARGRLEKHHIVGRVRGIPVHDGLVVWTCGPCNRLQYVLWQVAGLDDPEASIAIRLRRTATYYGIRGMPLDAELADFLVDQAECLEAP